MAVSKSLSRGAGFIGQVIDDFFKTGKDDLLDVMVYFIVSGLVGIAALLVGAAIGLAEYFLLAGVIGDALAVGIGAVLFVVVMIIGEGFAFAPSLGAVEFIYTGKRVDYFDSTNRDVAFKWVLFIVGVMVVLLAIIAMPIVAIGAGGVAGLAFMPIYILVLLLLILALALISVMFYYTYQELAIKKRSPIEALRASYRLVKNNFWETLLFAIVIWIASQVVSTALGIVVQIFALAAVVFWPLLIILGLLVLVASLVIAAAETILKVNFYKKLVEKKEVAKKKTAA